MQLFLIFFASGMLVCWLYVRNRNSWLHTIIGIVFGAFAAYGALYVMGNYVQADLIAQLKYTVGDTTATEITNKLYGTALKNAVGAIIGVAIALKIRSGREQAQGN